MYIPRFWARGDYRDDDGGLYSCWRWSDDSLANAQQLAQVAAQTLAEARRRGEPFPDRYSYGSSSGRPAKEAVISRGPGATDPESVVITCNSYGAQVLNCASAGFVDVDLKAQASGCAFFGGAKPPNPDKVLDRCAAWAALDRSRKIRVWKTAAGLRLLRLDSPMTASGKQADELMAAVGADPLYVRLCKAQDSFRARISPKHWRIGMGKPPCPGALTNDDDAAEAAMREWLNEYQQRSEAYAICELIADYGEGAIHPELEPILHVHEAACAVGTGKALA